MLEKKQIQMIFLFEFKMGQKQRQLATSTMYLVQELLMTVPCSGDSRSFTKEMRALKMRSTVAGHWKLTPIIWEDLWSSSYNYMGSCQRTHALVLPHLKQTGRMKNLDKWIPCELTTNLKNCRFKVSFAYSLQQQWTISQSDCGAQQKVDYIQQLTTASSAVGLKRSSKAFPKARLAPENGHGHCLVVCC